MREFAIRTTSGRVIVGPGWACEADVMASMHGHDDGAPAAAHGELVSRSAADQPWAAVR